MYAPAFVGCQGERRECSASGHGSACTHARRPRPVRAGVTTAVAAGVRQLDAGSPQVLLLPSDAHEDLIQLPGSCPCGVLTRGDPPGSGSPRRRFRGLLHGNDPQTGASPHRRPTKRGRRRWVASVEQLGRWRVTRWVACVEPAAEGSARSPLQGSDPPRPPRLPGVVARTHRAGESPAGNLPPPGRLRSWLRLHFALPAHPPGPPVGWVACVETPPAPPLWGILQLGGQERSSAVRAAGGSGAARAGQARHWSCGAVLPYAPASHGVTTGAGDHGQLGSYTAAKQRIPELEDVEHEQVRSSMRCNNCVEQAHQPTRVRERRMGRFRCPISAQRFLSAFVRVCCNLFRPRRHLLSASEYRTILQERFATWREITVFATA
jgi:hypothetical protein